jgi:hypothetical protein
MHVWGTCVGWNKIKVRLIFLTTVYVGLDRSVHIHRVWPYIWWFPRQKYRIPIHRIYMVLANPTCMPAMLCCNRGKCHKARSTCVGWVWLVPFVAGELSLGVQCRAVCESENNGTMHANWISAAGIIHFT